MVIWIEGFRGGKKDEADEQRKNMIEALKAAATEWTFELINFVAGRRGASVAGQTISITAHVNDMGHRE